MLIGSKTKKVPKPRKLVIVTDIVPFDALPTAEQEKDKILIDKIDDICR